MTRLSGNQVLDSYEETYYNDEDAHLGYALLHADLAERFYEGLCAPFAHEPTRDRFAVITTEEKGEGLISLTTFVPGQIVFRFQGKRLNEQTLFTLQQGQDCYIEDPVVMGKVLHACDPNMRADMRKCTFYATKTIMPGEFLTMDYETTEDVLFRQFHCGCGAINCRGPIRGRKLRNKQQ